MYAFIHYILQDHYGIIVQKKGEFGDGEVDGELICYIFYFMTTKKDVYLKDKI
ncbi:MAG: hypothetical protein IMY67_03965 [Bacteroidetes bacterium]|nr:hypothetical protein [Bacteroidota bacterium]